MALTRDEITRRKRLTWAMKNPLRALDNGWFQDPLFCQGFFDRCDQLVFVQSRHLIAIARKAVEIAEACGDPHLLHRAHGVLSHAYLARREYYWAHRTLGDVREQAFSCCPRCRSEHLGRLGDLLMEQGDFADSLAALDRALEEGGRDLDADARGRIHFVRSITHHLLGNRDRALADAGSTFELVDLSSPRGFFVETGALISIYVAGGDPCHDALGSELLASFDARINGQRGWGDWITRRTWSDAHLQARLGDFERARPLMRSAYLRLMADGLPREAVAAALDLGQLRCRAGLPTPHNWQATKGLIKRCRDRRPDLADDHRRGLGEILGVLETHPESAFFEMVELRRSFKASVPGVMAERIGPHS